MKSGLRFTATIVLFAVSAYAGAQADSAGTSVTTSVGNIQVRNVSISGISVSKVEVDVSLILIPSQSATLKNIQVCSLHLNGLPVFAAPVNQEIALHKGESVALPPVSITLYFRDLNTARPLREMIEKQNVHVQGEMVAGVEVNFLGKLALHSQHPRVVVPIGQDVPVEVGGTSLERNLLLGVLSAIDTEMESNGTAAKLIEGVRPAWIRDAENQAQPNLVVVESSYELSQASTPSRVNAEALGFRLSSGKIATSAEMLNPWKYDVELQTALSSGAVKLVKKSEEVTVRSLAGSAPALSLGAADFSTDSRGNAAPDKMTAVGKSREQVQVLRRASPYSMAVLTPRGVAAGAGLAAASEAVAAQDSWDKVIVFRLRAASATGERIVEPLQITAKRDGNSIKLSQPVDESVFGSPILTPDGVIGIVQDEQTGAFLPADLGGPEPPKS
ncbi:MAG TPA: hypothetical protein VKB38_01725 [Terracidiphilus sp.]|nr:hypothetical protein [Terracidiphilus sp.]